MNSSENEEALCPSCFSEWDGTTCVTCGFTGGVPQHMLALPRGTVLHENYLIGSVLGRPGGFGITYRAWDKTLRMKVAVKEYYPRMLSAREAGAHTIRAHTREDGTDFEAGLERFLEEARTLALFDHPNIVRVRTFFRQFGTAYLVMDFYEGSNLEEYVVRAGGKLTESEALRIMMPVLDGLREVHAHGFLHRDIKPQNIYITRAGRVILLDFGAAKDVLRNSAQTISLVYTPGFAAPEQGMVHGSLGPWTDVYSCAAVLWYMVHGSPPHTFALNDAHANAGRGPGDSTISRAIAEALVGDPRQRTQTMKHFQDALSAVGNGGPKETSNIAANDHSKATGRGFKKILIAAVVILLLVSVGAVVMNIDRLTAPVYDPAAVFKAALSTDSSEVRDSLFANLRMNAPNSLQGMYAIGDSLMEAEKYQEAGTIGQKMIAADSLFAYGHYLVARNYYELAQLDDATVAITQAEVHAPNESRFLALHCKILYMQDNLDDAIKMAERALAINEDSELRNRMIWTKNQNGMSREALVDIVNARKVLPDDSLFVCTHVRILSTLGKLADANDVINRYLKTNPNNVGALRERAGLWIDAGNTKRALQDINKALAIDNSDDILYIDKAIYSWQLNMIQEALEAYNKAVMLGPNRSDNWVRRGDFHREQMKDLGKACADYERAAQLGNSDGARKARKYCSK